MESVRCDVMDLSMRVLRTQENVRTIQSLVNQWKEMPLIERGCSAAGKADGLLNLKSAEYREKKQQRYKEVSEAAAKITELVADCKKYFRVDDSSENWRRYLSFVDEVIIDGLLRTVACSLGYLLDETDQTMTMSVLFEARSHQNQDK